MPVKNINGNSMWGIYKKQILTNAKALKPIPPDELISSATTSDTTASFDAFSDVTDELLGVVFHLSS